MDRGTRIGVSQGYGYDTIVYCFHLALQLKLGTEDKLRNRLLPYQAKICTIHADSSPSLALHPGLDSRGATQDAHGPGTV